MWFDSSNLRHGGFYLEGHAGEQRCMCIVHWGCADEKRATADRQNEEQRRKMREDEEFVVGMDLLIRIPHDAVTPAPTSPNLPGKG